MYTCNNCGAKTDHADNDTLIVSHVIANGRQVVITYCPACVTGTKIVKIVLKRNDAGIFDSEQYAALEMINKAFGK